MNILSLPRFILSPPLRTIAFFKYQLKSGPGCIIDPRCSFEGGNILQNNVNIFNSRLGRYTYIASNSSISNALIGRYCSIGSDVCIKVGRHPVHYVSTHPLFHSNLHARKLGFDPYINENKYNPHLYVDKSEKYVVKIGSDVWIGNRVTIMDGISVGDGAIVGAGSLVTKDIMPYQVVGGVPARFLKQRFTDNQVKFLLDLKWWEKNEIWIKNNSHLFESIESLTSAIPIK